MLQADRPTLADPPRAKGVSADAAPEPAITWRAAALGLVATVIVCAFTPYNDFALDGTPFVGNNLPLGMVSLALAYAVLVNGPLSRRRSRWALGTGEAAVAFAMGLVACCIPSSGLLRYFAPALVSPWWNARSSPSVRRMLGSLDLPAWAFPSMPERDVMGRANDPVITGFAARWTGDAPVPYGAWATPILAWGLFFAAAAGALFCLAAIVRRQWAENERLPFPLAAIQLALVERPAPGRWLNAALSSRPLWVTAGAVFGLRLWNGMAVYRPGNFPPIPMGYDFNRIFTEPPFTYIGWGGKAASVFPIIIGVTYFLSAPVAFSLWAFVALNHARRMVAGTAGTSPDNPGALDEHLGAALAYAGVLLWVGRAHWKLVARQAMRGERPGEPVGLYLPYRAAAWGLVGCAAAMVAWLAVAGCTVVGAGVIVAVLLTVALVLARVVAETGLVYTQMGVATFKPWLLMAQHGAAKPATAETFFYAGVLNVTTYDWREPLSVYATHALRLSDRAGVTGDAAGVTGDAAGASAGRAMRRRGAGLLGLLALALVVGYFVGWGSMLWTEYRYDVSLNAAPRVPLNWWGADVGQKVWFLDPVAGYVNGELPRPAHDPAWHIAGGFAFTALLGFLRTRFAWWPLHPVGYLMVPLVTADRMWFSIGLGWLAKVLVVRFGGSRAYVAGRSVFLGLILGDCVAAGFWLAVNVLLHAAGLPFEAVNVLPG